MTEWIKCIDRKPDNQTAVLVTDGTNVTIGYYDMIDFVGCESEIENIIAWMTLPQPPENI